METIHGYIERITFQSEENGFTVARLKEPGKKELTVVVGAMPSVQPGETVRCHGTWKNNPQFGLQFEVKSCSVEMPSDDLGIRKYLGSGLVKGIGPVFAERIVDRFGARTLEVIENEPHRLLEVSGIGEGRQERIRQCWGEQRAIREVMMFLQQYQVTPAFAQKIYRRFGADSIARMTANPYDLAKEVFGIGFKTADALAQKMGVPRDSPRRLDAGIEYVLWELSGDGHTCCPVPDFTEAAAKLLESDSVLIATRLDEVVRQGHVVRRALPAQEVDLIWLAPLHAQEKGIAREFARLLDAPRLVWVEQSELLLDQVQRDRRIQLADQQLEAVRSSLREKVLVVTGGPGTGKSTITQVIVDLWAGQGARMLLAAPTGRAAKRLAEITGREAQTLHQLLEFDFGTNGFRRGENNPLEADLVIVDEASMVDTALCFRLLLALPSPAHLILVGDVDQLPSVGPGKVLEDLIGSGMLPVVRLTEIFRQASASRIVTNAHRINLGLSPDLSNRPEEDFFFLEKENPEEIAALIVDLVAKRLPQRYGFNPVDDIQVLCPMKIGALGTIALNEQLQQRLNPTEANVPRAGYSFKVGDKVMQLRNNYPKGVFNGDIGRILSLDRIEQIVMVGFDQRTVEYDFSELDELSLSYAVSVHKYQGSECPCVVLPLHTLHYRMLGRNLLYTAVTRGKKLVVVVGTRKALWLAIGKTGSQQRCTGLLAALKVGREKWAALGSPIVVPGPWDGQ